jgi:tetratricopeptide (TPR) repeat protein
MDIQDLSRKQKLIPLFGGLVIAFLICGTPLFWFLSTGRFRQLTQPFAYAAQTAAGMPVSSATSTLVSAISGTPGPDLSTLSYSERFEIAGPYISEGLEHRFQGAYADSILAWDKALEIVPEFAEGYYNRGDIYLKMLNNQRSQEEFLFYLSRAGEDFDKAIELEPYHKGDYYLGRYKYYDNLASIQTYRVDRVRLEEIALDNLLLANQMGNFDPLAERYLMFSNVVVGNCDAAIELAIKLIETTTEPAAALPTGLALGYMCKNEAEKALPYIDEAINISDSCMRRFERAKVLFALGRNDDAMADLNHTISTDPYYCGDRYYLRGLIYAEMENLQKAQADLSFGMGQTWGRGGLLAYAQGKIALVQGNNQAALQYFQDAEATYPLQDAILVKIRTDLKNLSGTPVEVTPSFPPATVIPSPTPLLTPRPTSSPDPSVPTFAFTPDPRLEHASVVDIETKIEPVKLGWGFDRLWHFQPAQSLDHREVKQLSVWLISSNTSQRLPRQIFLWNFHSNMWGGNNELHWGENRINYANEYVSPDGDVYIHFVNQDSTLETSIDTFGITLILQRTNGSIEVHGITP